MPSSTSASGYVASSGNVTLFSSNTQGIYVFAVYASYPPASSVATGALQASTVTFTNGAGGTELFRACFAPPSTNSMSPPLMLAVTPPAYLFRSDTAVALVMNASSSGIHYAASAYRLDSPQ